MSMVDRARVRDQTHLTEEDSKPLRQLVSVPLWRTGECEVIRDTILTK